MSIPPPIELERICKGLAALDAILSAEWEFRYFSFNATWDSSGAQRMASMRNGEGDEWFIVFDGEHALMKAYWRDAQREDPAVVYAGLPAALEPQRNETAFSMDQVTFGGFYEPGIGWTLRGNPEPLAEGLCILSGDVGAYRSYAAGYFEVDVPIEAIEHVLMGKPLDTGIVASIAKDRTLESLESDLAEIGFGTLCGLAAS